MGSIASLPSNTNTNALSLANAEFFIALLQAQKLGLSNLPLHLGLTQTQYSQMMVWFDFDASFTHLSTNAYEKATIRQQLLELRQDEQQELNDLLLAHRRNQDVSEQWLANILAAGCLAGDHLWRDLGLRNRESLTALFAVNFPALAKKNSGVMRWKKFLYKQLCEQQGNFVCRSPSCETCSVYDECFGDEL